MKKLLYISSKHNDIIKNLIKIQKSPSQENFILEGSKFISDIDSNNILSLYISDYEKYKTLADSLLNNNKNVYILTENTIKYISSATSGQDMIAQVSMKNTNRPNKLIICDGVQNPGNIGTIIRTAAAFNFGCILSYQCANPYTQKVIQSTAGAIFNCYIKRTDILSEIKDLKSCDYTIFSSELDTTALTPENLNTGNKFAVIIGNEGNGVSQEISNEADTKIYIPIKNTNSLNASIAAGIFMYCFSD